MAFSFIGDKHTVRVRNLNHVGRRLWLAVI